MVVRYVTTDAGRWGTGLGRPLTAAEFDENIYTVKGIAETAAAQTPVSIEDFAVSGANFYVNLTDGSTAGPYVLPVSTITPRGEWAADTSYAVNDTIYVSGNASAYIVRYAHVSGVSFNEGATNGDGQLLYGKIVEAPTAALPSGGATGMILAKSSSDDYDIEWAYPTVLLPTGGATGQTLIKYGAVRNDASWADIPNDLPTGGATGTVLTKTSSTNYAVAWTAPLIPSVNTGATGIGTSALGPSVHEIYEITPTGNTTFTATAAVGPLSFVFTTTGSTAYTLTFGTGFKSTGTLSTGVTGAKVFVVQFIGDGSTYYEVSRTGAM
jgi:hypothetical protein